MPSIDNIVKAGVIGVAVDEIGWVHVVQLDAVVGVVGALDNAHTNGR